MLKHQHVREVLSGVAPAAWFEVHSENYLSDGGRHLDALDRIRESYALSCHGVGLSLGSATGLNKRHLARLKALFARYEPGLVSDHLSFSVAAGVYLNDLLPLPYTREALDVVVRNVTQAQEACQRQFAIENPSTYLRYEASEMSEPEFICELVRRSGCALLLDVNNVFVSARNLGFDPEAYLRAMPAEAVVEIHLAGHRTDRVAGEPILIDDHGSPVAHPVWSLLRQTLERIGPRPLLIEWDTDVPALSVLAEEVAKAECELAAFRDSGAIRAA